MALREELTRQGALLFRWRTYLPYLLLPLFWLALTQSGGWERSFWPWPERAWQLLSFGVGLLGVAVRVLVAAYVPAFTSGKNTRTQVAASLNTTGMYSVVRHPLYLGNYLVILGVLLAIEVWWLVVICSLIFWLYYERIMLAEEDFLRGQFGEEYDTWAGQTPCFRPRFKQWRAPALPFCWKTAVRREYSTVFLLFGCFVVVNLLGNGLSHHAWRIDPPLRTAVLIAIPVYLVLAVLKRYRKLLPVEGR